MKYKDKYKIEKGFEDLFKENSETETSHDAEQIMFRFLSEIERIVQEKTGEKIKKKELAQALKTSPSYITQLFNGDKLINLITLAKLQDVFDVTFDIAAKPNEEVYHKNTTEYGGKIIKLIPQTVGSEGGDEVLIEGDIQYYSSAK